MENIDKFFYYQQIFSAQKYKIILAILFVTVNYIKNCDAQQINAYRSVANGHYDNPAVWQRYNGTAWEAANAKPDRNNDIYIENPHRITLRQNEEVRSIYLNAATHAGEKLNINGFELNVYGSLNAFEGNAPGTPRGAWNSVNWIGNNVNSRLVFRGNSRVVVAAGSWSGFSTRSEYSVIFDPGEGVELIVGTHFKANQFIIRSGKVKQSWVDGTCAMFSFNTNPAYIGPYGALIIEGNGELESECNNNISIRSQSGNTPSALFDLQAGGKLTLLGNNPQIHSADKRFNGTVRYISNTGTQHFVTTNMAGAMIQRNYHHLEFHNDATKNLPPELFLSGNYTRTADSGPVTDNNTTLSLLGAFDQVVDDPDLQPRDLIVNKAGGIASFHHDLRIRRNFEMRQGSLDFRGNNLLFHSELSGMYSFHAGRWINLPQVNYLLLPSMLTAANASFPFYDSELGGVRTLTLLGNIGTDPTLLNVKYIQLPDVNWEPGFTDNDGTPILYKTNSYFELLMFPSNDNALEMRIDADDLIVLDPAHLRIVGDESAAPGGHLEGLEIDDQFLARRELTFRMLNNETFTIGSTEFPSILPVLWYGLEAKATSEGVLITWMDDVDDPTDKFLIHRSLDHIRHFQVVGEVNGQLDSAQRFAFLDQSLMESGWIYYQVEKINTHGLSSHSPVVRVHWRLPKRQLFNLYPNPYEEGVLAFELLENVLGDYGAVRIIDQSGKILNSFEGELGLFATEMTGYLEVLPSGFYFIEVRTGSERQVRKWIKK